MKTAMFNLSAKRNVKDNLTVHVSTGFSETMIHIKENSLMHFL